MAKSPYRDFSDTPRPLPKAVRAAAPKSRPAQKPVQKKKRWDAGDIDRAARNAHFARQDRKDKVLIGSVLTAVFVYAAIAMNLGPSLNGTGTKEKATASMSLEEQMQDRLKRFVQGREARIHALYDTYAAAVGESEMAVWLGKLKPYLGGSYGLPRAEEAYFELMESREKALTPDVKLARILTFNDALSNLLSQMPSYGNDYHRRWDVTVKVLNYPFPGREFYNDIGDEMRAVYKSHADAVDALDPRIVQPREFNSAWRPARPKAW